MRAAKQAAQAAQALAVQRSHDVPAGASGQSMDFGSDVTTRHVVELPGDKKPFDGGLAGLSAFTISGWIRVDSAAEGDGGNRVLNYCRGGPGIDLVWVNTGGGQLKLAVNEWPDGAHPTSSSGTIPVSSSGEKWPEWRFFAVTYDTARVAGGCVLARRSSAIFHTSSACFCVNGLAFVAVGKPFTSGQRVTRA